MRAIGRIFHITTANLCHIPCLAISCCVVAIITAVVSLFVSVQAMHETLGRASGASDPRRVIALEWSSDVEVSSSLSREQAMSLGNLSAVARDGNGAASASAEMIVLVPLLATREPRPRIVPLRGVQPSAFNIRREVAIVQGRRFERGVRELIVGTRVARELGSLGPGSRIPIRGADWNVVGTFESGGSPNESEIWVDAETAMTLFRHHRWQSMTLLLADGSNQGLADLRKSIDRDPRLSIAVYREAEYYGRHMNAISPMFKLLSGGVIVMVIVAVVGAMSYLDVAIAKRRVELARSRALGVGSVPIAVAAMFEALVLALLGAGAGGLLAYLYWDGASLAMLNAKVAPYTTFDLRITPRLLLEGLGSALIMAGAAVAFCVSQGSKGHRGDGGEVLGEAQIGKGVQMGEKAT